MAIVFSQAASLSARDLFTTLESGNTGLTSHEGAQRLEKFGTNQVEEKDQRVMHLLFRQLRSPFIYLLVVAALVSLLLGAIADSILIFIFVLVNSVLGFIQEYRSHKAVRLLRRFLIHECLILRDGTVKTIQSAMLVPGDVVLVKAGDKIPADIRFLETESLTVDESTLTGESTTTVKMSDPLLGRIEEDYFQATNIGFSGTVVVSGKGKGLVFATGTESQLGSIAHRVVTTKTESAFEQGIARFSRFILKLSLGTIVVIFLLNFLIKGEAFQFGQFVVFSLALVVGVIPEALPLVMTVSLSSGALRLAQKKVVPKRLSAIEDLGSIEVLATDKTGTLTENTLTVAEVYSHDVAKTLELAILASSYFSEYAKNVRDPFEEAIWARLEKKQQDQAKTIRRREEHPFDPVRKCAGAMVEMDKKNWVVTLGAPDDLVIGNEKQHKWVTEQGKRGRRVLAVGRKERKNGIYSEENLSCFGLISFIDPLKKTTQKALDDAKELGVTVKILTGDSVEVSLNIALETGLIHESEELMAGKDWRGLSEEKKKEAVRSYHVFARLTPEDKYDIVRILKEVGYTVGFLGEGFNDAPALELAHVGLAVPSAADIAREASDIILLNRSLEVIIDGIKEGRSTFANTFKYIKSTLTSNFGNFYTLAIASLLVKFLPMLPTQILLVNLLSDFPMVSIAADTVDHEELVRPRSYDVGEIAFFATILGLISTIIDFAIFAFFLRFGEATLQTMWFIGSILTELLVFYSIRTRGWFFNAGKPAGIIVALTVIVGIITVIIPFTFLGQSFFGFVVPRLNDLVTIGIFVLIYVGVSEVSKIIYYKSFAKQK